MNGKLAVLVPVFNGGDRLVDTVRSCATAGLSGDEYEVIVVDNHSTDNAPGRLPGRDSAGAEIRVYRNPVNTGRINNWNRAIEIAMARGGSLVTFLFAGDEWLPTGALRHLVRLMKEEDATLGLAPFLVAQKNGRIRRSHRFHFDGGQVVMGSREFLSALVQSGLLPLGPLQANVYRLKDRTELLFNPDLPTRTDVDTTTTFIHERAKRIVLISSPFMQWREHGGRFHASIGAGQIIQDYMASFNFASGLSGIDINYKKAKAQTILNSLRLIASEGSMAEWPVLLRTAFAAARECPHETSYLEMTRSIWQRVVSGRRLIEFRQSGSFR